MSLLNHALPQDILPGTTWVARSNGNPRRLRILRIFGVQVFFKILDTAKRPTHGKRGTTRDLEANIFLRIYKPK
jgi:hypothetical protein